MMNPYRVLPPLGSLIGFEAAARLGSFSLAAEELNLTQSAISHQIRTLESHLQQPLFHRNGRAIDLTDAGKDLYKTSRQALETIRQGVRRLDAYAKPGTVVIQMPTPVAVGWYMPRLQRLTLELKGVEPWLYSGELEGELQETEFDISFRTKPPSLSDELGVDFLAPRRVPLCAPDLRDQFEKKPEIAALIHDEADEDWQTWYLQAGIERENTAGGINFSDPVLALEAAVKGLGVYLGNAELADPWLQSGQLVACGHVELQSANRLYAVVLRRNMQRPAVSRLWNWLVAEIEKSRGG